MKGKDRAKERKGLENREMLGRNERRGQCKEEEGREGRRKPGVMDDIFCLRRASQTVWRCSVPEPKIGENSIR